MQASVPSVGTLSGYRLRRIFQSLNLSIINFLISILTRSGQHLTCQMSLEQTNRKKPSITTADYTHLPGDDEDTSPLLENDTSVAITGEIEDEESQVRLPQGTILSSCINLSNTILGSGMVAMPSAVAATGLLNGMLLIAICGSASAFGLLLLSKMAAQVGRKSSFFTCASITYPSAAIYFDLAIAIKCFGVSVSYLVIVGSLLPQIVQGFAPNVPLDSIWLQKQTWITVGMILVAPTCFLRRLDSLRYTSAFSLLAVLYLVFIVNWFYFSPSKEMPPKPTWEELDWFKFDSGFVSHFPIFVFAFTCHQNIFSVHNELEDNSSAQVEKVIGRSLGLSLLVYQMIGTIGYLTFGKQVTSNIIAQCIQF